MNAQPSTFSTEVKEEFYHKVCFTRCWLGYPIQQNPLDLIMIQQLIYDTRPDVLIETGSGHGGSALFYAMIMDELNHGLVISIDTHKWELRPRHDRIFFIEGSSIDKSIMGGIENYCGAAPRRMVVLDSSHTKEHVLKELNIWAPLVTWGSYVIVQDTNIHGHPIRSELPEGPWEAVHEWIINHPEFEIDHNVEPPISNCPDGWLKKVK